MKTVRELPFGSQKQLTPGRGLAAGGDLRLRRRGQRTVAAAYRGNLDLVRSLVEAGADVTARDERFGATALDWAGWTK